MRLHYLLTHSDWSEEDCSWMEDCIQNHEEALYAQFSLLLEEDESVENVPEFVSERIKRSLLNYINAPAQDVPSSKHLLHDEAADFFQMKLEDEVIWTQPAAPEQAKQGANTRKESCLEKKSQRSLFRKKISWAAAIFLLLILSIFMGEHLQKDTEVPFTDKIGLNQTNILAEPDTIFNTSNEERIVYLSDSTKVNLNPKSYIYFDKEFALDKKIVHISGEAIFTVNKEIDRPFSVYADNMEVRDLGTVFYVNNRSSHLSVKLIEGKVLLHSMENAKVIMEDIVMKPGELFKMDKNTSKFQLVAPNRKAEKNPLKIERHTKGPFKSMNFVNTPLTNVLDDVADKYHLYIKYNKKGLEDKLFTGNLSRVSSADKVLLLICIPNNLHYSKEGDTIVIE